MKAQLPQLLVLRYLGGVQHERVALVRWARVREPAVCGQVEEEEG